jgi:type I restriction enzyme S subunit
MAYPQIGLRQVRNIPLPIPPVSEQERIVEVVEAHTGVRTANQDHREKLQNLKTGLMQDLLTGRVRVPEAEDRVDEVIA